MFIHEYENWPEFRWNEPELPFPLESVILEQGKLLGRMTDMGFENKLQTVAENLVKDIIYSSEIEGIRLNADEVRSSIARHLGLQMENSVPSSHYVDAVVTVTLDAMHNYDSPLTETKLCQWQAAFFPTGRSAGIPIETGMYRTHEEHIVSGAFGRERIHYIAPAPERIRDEMKRFLEWFNRQEGMMPSIVKSAIAHFWFVSIHPFEDGNGRLGRILGDIMLARGERNSMRFFNLSAEINRDKKHYYDILERTQRGDGDITEWLSWYMGIARKAIREANLMMDRVLAKSIFWKKAGEKVLNARQIHTLNLFLDGYEAKITSKSWAALNKCSKDTALRDIEYLVNEDLLVIDIPGAKRPSYSINYGVGEKFLQQFKDIQVTEDKDIFTLSAIYKDVYTIKERILKLDAERFLNGDLPEKNLLQKYCSHLAADRKMTEPRISDISIYPPDKMNFIKCRIDGEWQSGMKMKEDDVIKWKMMKDSKSTEEKDSFLNETAAKYFRQKLDETVMKYSEYKQVKI